WRGGVGGVGAPPVEREAPPLDGGREMEVAIKVTEEKLKALKGAVEKRKRRASLVWEEWNGNGNVIYGSLIKRHKCFKMRGLLSMIRGVVGRMGDEEQVQLLPTDPSTPLPVHLPYHDDPAHWAASPIGGPVVGAVHRTCTAGVWNMGNREGEEQCVICLAGLLVGAIRSEGATEHGNDGSGLLGGSVESSDTLPALYVSHFGERRGSKA
ncbi:hypothetical protein V491_08776, partial [Pseudogymnoascus sp. VKM F-3775]